MIQWWQKERKVSWLRKRVVQINTKCFAPVGYAEGRLPVKRSTYDERDYVFGQVMLTLRTNIGLTQAGLAERLGVSRRAVAEWEAGSA